MKLNPSGTHGTPKSQRAHYMGSILDMAVIKRYERG